MIKIFNSTLLHVNAISRVKEKILYKHVFFFYCAMVYSVIMSVSYLNEIIYLLLADCDNGNSKVYL